MIRRILGFALIAIIALLVFKVALGLLGVLLGLAVSVLVLAALGYASICCSWFSAPEPPPSCGT